MQQKDIFSHVLDQISDGIYLVYQDRLEYVNSAFIKMTGVRLEEVGDTAITKLDFLKQIHPEDRKLLLLRNTLRKAGRPVPPEFEIRGVLKDGASKHFSIHASPLPHHPDYIIGIARDITGTKKTENEYKEVRDRCDTIIKNANDGIAIIQDGLFQVVNPNLIRSLGYPAGELIGKPFHNIVATDHLDEVVKLYQRDGLGEKKAASFEAVLKTRRLKRIIVEINVSETIYDGKPAYFAIIHDITKHRELEQELRDTLEKLRVTMAATTQAISMIVESRDPYTAGHQRRVADLARAIATEMGLPMEQIDAIRMAGILHDLGKISVPSEILTKPTQLNESEFNLIKAHPQTAYDILKTIDTPWPIAQIVYQHHERINGSGYPRGLTENGILLEAKILAVADVVEAMISHRPYRAARTLDETLEEISKNKGILYDPKVVDICLKLFKKKKFTFRLNC
jgi:PAS domain S-box-containing protein/putative nucleotidyltransferase with HDIG domain